MDNEEFKEVSTMTPEIYTRDSDGKKFIETMGRANGTNGGRMLYLEPIDDNPMPELRLGDYIIYEVAERDRESHYVTDVKESIALEKTTGIERVIHYRNGKLIWERKP